MEEISEHNIKEIRFSCAEYNFEFLNTSFNNLIVPINQKHINLIKKFRVPKVVLDYYYSRVKYSIKHYGLSEFRKEFDFINLDTLYNPFTIIINGAFWDKNSLCSILTDFNAARYLYKGQRVTSLETLKPLFDEYSRGFKKGFEEFDNTNIEPYLNNFSDKEDYFRLVFNFINSKEIIGETWFMIKGLSIDNNYEINLNSAFKLGLHWGFMYKAWYIVFSNSKMFEEFFIQALSLQQTSTETIKYTAKHYVLAYLIECNAKGESFPIGQKKELERIGNNRMGTGKGNRFYKVFNEIVNKDLNAENNLIEIGGEDWRKIVKNLSNDPKTVEHYLQNKQL